MNVFLKIIKNQKGIGLPEVSMGIAILSILLSAVTGALNTSFDIFNFHENNIYEQSQSTIILGRLTNNLRNCTAIEEPLQQNSNGSPTTILRGSFSDTSQSHIPSVRRSFQTINKSLIESNLDNNTNTVLSEACIESLTFLRDERDSRIIYVNLEIRNPNSRSNVTNNFRVQKIIFADNVRSFVNG